MYKNVIYVVDEVKGVTCDIKLKDGKLGKLVTNLNQNVVRSPKFLRNTSRISEEEYEKWCEICYNMYGDNSELLAQNIGFLNEQRQEYLSTPNPGYEKPYIKVSLTQPVDIPAIIVCENHRFEMQQVEIAGGQRRFWVKTSLAIRVASNLHDRGVAITMVNYKGKNKETTKILPQDNFYDKIDEFCGVNNTKAKTRLGKEFKKADKIKSDITLSSFNNLDIKLLDYFSSTEHAKVTIDMFRRYATIYGLDTTKPEDLLTFKFCIEHPDCADVFLDGTKFRCPKCGNVVHVNGHEEYINGKPVNTFETVCDYCGEEFDIHDKQDILDMLAAR
jgi:hypothetical protein